MKKRLILGLASLIGILLIVFYLKDYVDVNYLISYEEDILNFVKIKYIYSIIIFVMLYIVSTIISIPGFSMSLSIISGYIYGVFIGSILVNIGATLGAAVVFLAVRYFFGNYVQENYMEELKGINKEVKEKGEMYFLISRMIIVMPFTLINIVSGFTKIDFKKYFIYTSLGIWPGVITYTYLGSKLKDIRNIGEVSILEVIKPLILITSVLILSVYLKNKYIGKSKI